MDYHNPIALLSREISLDAVRLSKFLNKFCGLSRKITPEFITSQGISKNLSENLENSVFKTFEEMNINDLPVALINSKANTKFRCYTTVKSTYVGEK
jgi:hypothetical protein